MFGALPFLAALYERGGKLAKGIASLIAIYLKTMCFW